MSNFFNNTYKLGRWFWIITFCACIFLITSNYFGIGWLRKGIQSGWEQDGAGYHK